MAALTPPPPAAPNKAATQLWPCRTGRPFCAAGRPGGPGGGPRHRPFGAICPRFGLPRPDPHEAARDTGHVRAERLQNPPFLAQKVGRGVAEAQNGVKRGQNGQNRAKAWPNGVKMGLERAKVGLNRG